MFGSKKIILNDNGVEKSFTVSPLSARAAMQLLRELLMLFTDTDLIHSLVLQQFIHKVISSGVEVENAKQEELNQMLQLDTPVIITNLIKSIMHGLTEQSLDIIIDKALAAVIYHNGEQTHTGIEALQYNMIKDFTVVIDLLYEVFMMNYGVVIERLKKLQGPSHQEEAIPAIKA